MDFFEHVPSYVSHHKKRWDGDIIPADICFGDVKPIPRKGTSNPCRKLGLQH